MLFFVYLLFFIHLLIIKRVYYCYDCILLANSGVCTGGGTEADIPPPPEYFGGPVNRLPHLYTLNAVEQLIYNIIVSNYWGKVPYSKYKVPMLYK